MVGTIGPTGNYPMTKLLFFNVPATGHVNPTLPVTAELIRRGAQLITYNTEAYRAKVVPTGAEFRPYPEIVERTFAGLDGSQPMLSARRFAELCVALLPEMMRIVEAEQPDALLFDSMCSWGALAGRLSGVPTVSSMALLVMTPGSIAAAGLLPQMIGYLLTSVPHLRAYAASARQFRRAYGVSLPSPPDFLNQPGTITVSYTSAEVQPGAQALGESYKFVGPIIAPRDDGSFPFERLDARPLIYISLGTLVNDRPDFYRACLQAFGGGDQQVVMVVPSRIDASTLGDIPPNFIIRSYVPQLELFPRTALCISHGGMNTVQEALTFGVPLVLVPQQLEQRMNAARFAQIGAAITLRNPSPDAHTLASAARRALGDARLKTRAEQIGAGLRAAGGAQLAADEILRLAGG
jgi:MGT family glycosyltransferase